ncbi:hypothetical protein NDU88_006651 [Pleurodeles waltl]|uniref:Uncharacterized protein n=1 Tax=Pleurodeles waltl TaxID=8319 RepID=A0AAV7PLK1_PLEWA|nr:hypothetical protein NDU88_006651 [Pleurodeles waltl]
MQDSTPDSPPSSFREDRRIPRTYQVVQAFSSARAPPRSTSQFPSTGLQRQQIESGPGRLRGPCEPGADPRHPVAAELCRDPTRCAESKHPETWWRRSRGLPVGEKKLCCCCASSARDLGRGTGRPGRERRPASAELPRPHGLRLRTGPQDEAAEIEEVAGMAWAACLTWSPSGPPPGCRPRWKTRQRGEAAKKKQAACSSGTTQRPHQRTKPRGRTARKEKVIEAALTKYLT